MVPVKAGLNVTETATVKTLPVAEAEDVLASILHWLFCSVFRSVCISSCKNGSGKGGFERYRNCHGQNIAGGRGGRRVGIDTALAVLQRVQIGMHKQLQKWFR